MNTLENTEQQSNEPQDRGLNNQEARDIKENMEKYKEYMTPFAILVAASMISLAILASGGFTFAGGNLLAKADQEKENTIAFGPEMFAAIANAMDVNINQFEECVSSRKYQAKVEQDLQEGINLGVKGTPGTFVNNRFISGAVPDLLFAAIDAELNGEDSGNGDVQISVTEQDHIRGNMNAPITIVEFSDFECPFCSRFHPSLSQAMNTYGDDIRWVYKHFPLDNIHPHARPAAEAAECIGEQKGSEGFWQFADALFNNQQGIVVN